MPKLLHDTIENNKRKIERAALHLFTRKGFHGTTVREIAKKAGVSMGKLYIYYDTKEDIFIDLVNHLGRKMEIIRQKELIPLMSPTSACSWPAPIRMSRSTRASPTSPSTCCRTASTCARSRR